MDSGIFATAPGVGMVPLTWPSASYWPPSPILEYNPPRAPFLDLKVRPRAPAFAGHLAAVGFAGQVHPGAGGVLDPVAGGAERRVCIQAEALGAAAFGQRHRE